MLFCATYHGITWCVAIKTSFGRRGKRGGGEDRFQEKRESASDDRSSSKHETQTRSEGNARVALRRSSQPLSLVSGVFL